MGSPTRPRALILDYGGVLSLPPRRNARASMARRLGVEEEEFIRAYQERRAVYDAGSPAEEYWTQVLARLSRAHLASPAMVATLIDDDAASWSELRKEMWDLAHDFRASGGKTALLTNNIPTVMERLRARHSLDDYFDVVVASCEVGVCKPEPKIFLTCLARLQVSPGDALFVDDYAPNVAAAASIGHKTFLFDGEAATLRLRRLLFSEVGSDSP